MEGVAVGNLIDFDLTSSVESPAPHPSSASNGGNTTLHLQPDVFATQGLLPSPILPSPLAPSVAIINDVTGGVADGDGDGESDATESADSENDGMDSPSHQSQVSRRSSSSSTHSGEDEELAEKRQFIKAYVEKVFHSRWEVT